MHFTPLKTGTCILILLILLMLTVHISLGQGELYADIENLIQDLEFLDSKGVDTTTIIDLLNKAIYLLNEGKVNESRQYIDEAKAQILELKKEADLVYLRLTLTKALTVLSLLSLPIMIYLFLPRTYLYLWYRFRRKWVIR